MQDSAWFCKIMLNSETFCMFYEKFEAYLPKILLRNYQRLKQTLPIWRYGVQKLNYQRSKLPILKVTNIEVYLYFIIYDPTQKSILKNKTPGLNMSRYGT